MTELRIWARLLLTLTLVLAGACTASNGSQPDTETDSGITGTPSAGPIVSDYWSDCPPNAMCTPEPRPDPRYEWLRSLEPVCEEFRIDALAQIGDLAGEQREALDRLVGEFVDLCGFEEVDPRLPATCDVAFGWLFVDMEPIVGPGLEPDDGRLAATAAASEAVRQACAEEVRAIEDQGRAELDSVCEPLADKIRTLMIGSSYWADDGELWGVVASYDGPCQGRINYPGPGWMSECAILHSVGVATLHARLQAGLITDDEAVATRATFSEACTGDGHFVER